MKKGSGSRTHPHANPTAWKAECTVQAEGLDEAAVLPAIKAFVAAEREVQRAVTCVQVTNHLLSVHKLHMESDRDMGREYERLHQLVYRFLKRRNWICGGAKHGMRSDAPAHCNDGVVVDPSA